MNGLEAPHAEARYGLEERPATYRSERPESEYGSELDLVKLLRIVWRGRWYIVLGTIAGALLAAVVVISSRVVGPNEATYNSALVLTVPGAVPGHYPNGSVFAPSDLRSPVILDKVYRDNKLQEKGVMLITAEI